MTIVYVNRIISFTRELVSKGTYDHATDTYEIAFEEVKLPDPAIGIVKRITKIWTKWFRKDTKPTLRHPVRVFKVLDSTGVMHYVPLSAVHFHCADTPEYFRFMVERSDTNE